MICTWEEKKCGGVLIDLVQSANQDWIIVVE